MPRLTPSGRVVSGLGRIPLDEPRVIGQQQVDGAWRLCVDGVPVSDRGCNALAAGNGKWLAWLDGYGLFGPHGLVSMLAGLPATLDGRSPSASDGTVAVVIDRANGRGLELIAPDGSSNAVPDALLTDQLCVVDRTRALWFDAGTRNLRTCGGLPEPSILPGPMGWPHVLNVNGEWWISYQSTDESGMVLHPFNSFSGYRITLPPAFYQDAIVLPNGLVRLTWARGSDDSDIKTRDIDVAHEPRVDLRAPNPGTPIPNPGTPEPPKQPEPKSMSVNHLDVVQRIAQSITPDGSPEGNFRFIAAVQQAVGDGAGFVKSREGAENTIAYHGGFVRTSRLIYSDGHLYKLLADAGPGGTNRPQWADEGMDDPALYVAASGDVPEPPKPPEPPPVVDLSEVINRLRSLDTSVEYLKDALIALHSDVLRTNTLLQDVEAKLDALAAKEVKVQFPPYVGGLGMRLRLTPEEKK